MCKIISLSACGSFKDNLSPGTFVIVDQFIDRTFARQKSFFGTGLVAHVGFGQPVCSDLGDILEEGCKKLLIKKPIFVSKIKSKNHYNYNHQCRYSR